MNASASTRGERRAARLNDPRFERFRTPAVRRRLVVAMAGILLAEAAVLLVTGAVATGPLSSVAVLAVFFLLIAAFVACLAVLKASTRGVEELDPALLDERQQQVRGVVYAQAYHIGSTLVVALLAAVVLWFTVAEVPPPSGVIVAVLLLVFHVTLVLPTMVAAWHDRV